MLAPTLTTERLTLRALTMADWEPYAEMWADPRVTTFIGGEPRTRDVAWKSFGQAVGMWLLFGYGNWGVHDETGFIGVAGLSVFKRDIAELDGFPEAGWVFVPESWGRGIAREAVGAFHEWVDRAGLGETRCIIAPEHAASIRVAEKCGYARIGEVTGKLGVSVALRRPAPATA